MLPLFQDNFILGEVTSSHFSRVTTSTHQLLFRDSYFFRTAAFFSFFRTVTFSQELLFQNSFYFGAKLLQRRHFLRIRSYLQQLLFGTAILSRGAVQDKDIKKELIFQSKYFCTVSTFSEKTDFGKIFQYSAVYTYTFWRTVFLERLLFQKALPSIAATFSEELLFLQHTFSQELLFHSYSSVPQSHYLLIRQ